MIIIKAIDGLNELTGRLICVFAVIFAAIIIGDVAMRYLLNAPTRWAFDVSKQLFGFYFILLGGYTLRHGGHVRVDILAEQLSPRAQKFVDAAGYLLFFFPFAWVFFYRSLEFAQRSWSQGETTYSAIQLPVYPLKMAMCLAAFLLLLQGVSEFLKILLNRREAHT